MMPNNAARRWCFTLNNWTDPELQTIVDASDTFVYLVIGRERGDSGTPHLQGFFILPGRGLRIAQIKALYGRRLHLEVARGTPQQASAYCKKEDPDPIEYGQLPADSSGKRTDFDSLKEWIKEQETRPTDRDVAEAYPSLWGRYRSACVNFLDLFSKRPTLVEGNLRPWQQALDDKINEEPDDRKIFFVVDPDGNKGKSWLTRKWFSTRDDLQRLSVGKRDDLAFAIDVTKRIFVFDIPRGQSELLQYPILESIKDQMIFSPKYESVCKIIPHKVHVIVFMNEEPNREVMTNDRYKIIYI